MRTLEEARNSWPYLERCHSLQDLRSTTRSLDSFPRRGLRSTCWKAFLLFNNVDRSNWEEKLQSSRKAYQSLHKHYLQPLQHQDEVDAFIDPLSEGEDSPWEAIRKDELLRQEIFQDVDRCMPDNLYFRQPDTQSMLLDILFTWAKLNPDVSYRQGMHEIAAPILWVVERDAVDTTTTAASERQGSDELIYLMFDSTFVAHDTFALFGLVMQNMKSSYEHSEQRPPSALPQGLAVSSMRESPIVARCREIMEVYLARTDPYLATHLTDIGVVAQVFLIRWIRLLFGREFSLDQTLKLWDRIFAEDHSTYCIDLICVSMLLRIRWELLDADYNTALQLLLRYPESPPEHDVPTFVDDAIYLKTHLNSFGGSHIVSRRTGRRPALVDEADVNIDVPLTPATPPSGVASPPADVDSPSRRLNRATQYPAGLEGLLEDAARGMWSRGERWGRGVVGEVRKNVQQVQSRTHSRMQSRTFPTGAEGGESRAALLQRVEALESRNRALGEMLESSVSTLWENQRAVEDASETQDSGLAREEQTERLTAAIAKVQLVSVYLADSSLALPMEEEPPGLAGPLAEAQSQAGGKAVSQEPESFADLPASETEEEHQPPPSSSVIFDAEIPTGGSLDPDYNPTPAGTKSTRSDTLQPTSSKSTRPALAQSRFSWMLGQDSTPAPSLPQSSPSGDLQGAAQVSLHSQSRRSAFQGRGQANTQPHDPTSYSPAPSSAMPGSSSTLARKAFISASPFREGSWGRASSRMVSGKGFLFGDEEEEVQTGGADEGNLFGRRGSIMGTVKGKGREAEKKRKGKEERGSIVRLNTMRGDEQDDDGLLDETEGQGEGEDATGGGG